MAKQRPPIELDQLSQTLKDSKGQGMGAFFPSTPPPQENSKPSESPTPQMVKNLAPEPVKDAESNDVTTSVRQDVNHRMWRDIIENTETRGSSLRLTNDEIFAVEDMLKDLERRMKIKTSLNEAARLGLLYIIEDFKKNKEKSLIYKVKKS